MKIVLLGKDGQLGRQLLRSLRAEGEVTAWGRQDANLANPEAVVARFASVRPEVIVNAAAYTAVDRAESEAEKARLVNAVAVGAIAGMAARTGALLVHYSTDYVFDGVRSGCYAEDDEPAPLSVYGATKLAGEQAIRESGCRHLLVRTSWVHAPHGANFIRTMLSLAQSRESLRVVADQHGAPTSVALIADVTIGLLRRLARGGDGRGIYHVSARGETSWWGLARFVIEQARAAGLPLRVGPEAVQPIATSDCAAAARRLANSRLCLAKVEAALGKRLPAWEEGVRATVSGIVAELLR
jgi:dTDP-4-dehydrorhamnose reductase